MLGKEIHQKNSAFPTHRSGTAYEGREIGGTWRKKAEVIHRKRKVSKSEGPQGPRSSGTCGLCIKCLPQAHMFAHSIFR